MTLPPDSALPVDGGRPWLDLLNTVVLGEDTIATADHRRVWRAALSLPEAGDDLLPALRDALRPAVDALRAGTPLPDALLATVNRHLADLRVGFSLDQPDGRPTLRTRLDATAPAIIAEDFARFACDHAPERLKHCANPTCTMVFYDTGKNNTRRWCAMSLCGNRAKVARYRARGHPAAP